MKWKALALVLAAFVVTSCARPTEAAKKLQEKGAPASLVELALAADALQPERAQLLLSGSGCRSGALRVHRSSSDTYEWEQGQLTDTWNTRDEFRFNVQAAATEWNSCTTLDLYFDCLKGVDDSTVHLTVECGESILARRTDTGSIALGPTVYHNN